MSRLSVVRRPRPRHHRALDPKMSPEMVLHGVAFIPGSTPEWLDHWDAEHLEDLFTDPDPDATDVQAALLEATTVLRDLFAARLDRLAQLRAGQPLPLAPE